MTTSAPKRGCSPTATDLPLEEAVRRVTALGGLAIPAHIDRPILQPARQSRLRAARPRRARARDLPSDRSRRGSRQLSRLCRLSSHPRQRRAPAERHAPRHRLRGRRCRVRALASWRWRCPVGRELRLDPHRSCDMPQVLVEPATVRAILQTLLTCVIFARSHLSVLYCHKWLRGIFHIRTMPHYD